MTHSTNRTLVQTIAAIKALDLSMIKFKATRTEDGYGWSAEYADQMEQAYKRCLILVAKYPEMSFAPEQDVDRFWHMHILDTRKYAADCEATFGYFLHHYPYLGLRGEGDEQVLDDAFQQMQSMLAKEFGETNEKGEAAWCGMEPTSQAAWCGMEPTAKAAWCGLEPTLKAAWCGFEPTVKTAAAQPTAKAAWCGMEPTGKAAWCGFEPTVKATALPTAKAAWCGFEPTLARAA